MACEYRWTCQGVSCRFAEKKKHQGCSCWFVGSVLFLTLKHNEYDGWRRYEHRSTGINRLGERSAARSYLCSPMWSAVLFLTEGKGKHACELLCPCSCFPYLKQWSTPSHQANINESQHGHRFAGDIFKSMFCHENICSGPQLLGLGRWGEILKCIAW